MSPRTDRNPPRRFGRMPASHVVREREAFSSSLFTFIFQTDFKGPAQRTQERQCEAVVEEMAVSLGWTWLSSAASLCLTSKLICGLEMHRSTGRSYPEDRKSGGAQRSHGVGHPRLAGFQRSQTGGRGGGRSSSRGWTEWEDTQGPGGAQPLAVVRRETA